MKGSSLGNNRMEGRDTNQLVDSQPNSELGSEVRRPAAELPNMLLAHEAVLIQETRSAQWNGSGAGFIELQMLFNSQFEQLNDISYPEPTCNQTDRKETSNE